VHDLPASEPQPSERAVSRDEEAILWRSVENIPEIYREPLILFYREHQSVEAVAAELELSEEGSGPATAFARTQTVAGGSCMAFVENTLCRTAPGPGVFLGGGWTALPAIPATAAGVSVAGKGAGGGEVRFS